MPNRVVIAGIAGVSPLGHDWPAVRERLLGGKSGVAAMPEWAEYEGLRSPRSLRTRFVLTNNFAFGGVNTSLTFKRWDGE